MKKYLVILLVLISINVSAQVPSYVPTSGLVGYWPFNGNANDVSGNGNNGTVNGSILTNDRFGKPSAAYSFDGSNDYIQTNCQAIPAGGSRTVSFWAKTIGNTVYPNQDNMNVLCYGGIGDGRNFEVALNHGCEGLSLDINAGVRTKSAVVNDDDWNFYSIVYDNTNGSNFNSVVYYKNSIEIMSACSPGTSTPINTSNDNPIVLGAYWNHLSRFFQGKLDDIGIWNRALTQQEITGLYNGNICFETVRVTDTLVINVNRTGYNPITYSNTIKVYPNPANNKITIDNGDIQKMNGYSIKIINSLGQQVYQGAITQQIVSIDITQWTGNGMYYLQLTDNNGNIIDVKKIVLQ